MGKDLLYFDAFVRIGPRSHKHLAQPWRLEHVMAEMDHCSISGAMVASTLSVTNELMYSNLELSKWVKPHEHLFALWNIMPHHTLEFPAPSELEKLMKRHDVRAVTIYPRENFWDYTADHADELFRMLARRRTLVILPIDQIGSHALLGEFLLKHSRLNVLLVSANWHEARLLVPLMLKHGNLHMTLDRFHIHCAPEFLCGLGLEDRVVFASNAPMASMGAQRCTVDYAEASLAVRQKIAGGNLARLLQGLKPPRLRANPDEDVLMCAARHGKPLPLPFVDMHMHNLPEGMNGGGNRNCIPQGGPKGMFHLLKRLGCVGGGFMSWNGVISCDSLAGNTWVKDGLAVAPKGYWGLATFDTTHYSQAELARHIPSLYEDKRFIGMKPYHYYGVEYHHSSYDIWWKFGEKNRFYGLIHRTRGDFKEVETLAVKYPGVRWVVAHCGADYNVADMAIECIRKHSNVYAEITWTSVTMGAIDYLVQHAGPHRIVYGTDTSFRDPRPQLGWVVFSRLSLEEKRRVLFKNGLDIIRPCKNRLPLHNRPPGL